MSEENELLPCPCCGGPAYIAKGYAVETVWAHGNFQRVYCGACQLRQLFYRTKGEAVRAWNRRTK